MRKARAFTLVELLVVVSILAVLMAILLPAVRNARAWAEVSACAANQRTIAQAMVLYGNDYRNALPHTGIGSDWAYNQPTWRQNLLAYLGPPSVDLTKANTPDAMVFACPANPVGGDDHRFVNNGHPLIRGTRLSYVANGQFDRIGGGVEPPMYRYWTNATLPNGQPTDRAYITRRFSQFPSPAQTILIHEGGYATEPATGLIWLDVHNVRQVPDRWWFVHPAVGVATFSFVDGHVEAMSLPASLEPSRWDINGLQRVNPLTRDGFEFLQQWHTSR